MTTVENLNWYGTHRTYQQGEKILLISVANELTNPEFHFETETEVDSLTGVHQCKGNYVLNGCSTIFTHMLPWVFNSWVNNFQLKMRLRFYSVGLILNLLNSQ